MLFTFTILLDPEPLPSTIIVVPPPEGEGVGDEEGKGLPEGEGVAEGFGVSEGFGVGEIEGVAEGFTEGEGFSEGEGLGKLAATEKELPVFPALEENKPKTDSLRAIKVRTIKNDDKKYVFLIIFLSYHLSFQPCIKFRVNSGWNPG